MGPTTRLPSLPIWVLTTFPTYPSFHPFRGHPRHKNLMVAASPQQCIVSIQFWWTGLPWFMRTGSITHSLLCCLLPCITECPQGSGCTVSKETALSTQVDMTDGWCVGRRHQVTGPASGGRGKGNFGKRG